ncbi:MAG: chromosomal replication initiator protein DnaA [Nitrospinae bacterium]|nr:chromosomal replication initiator protein DnaA [Nitrospinota bacterium]
MVQFWHSCLEEIKKEIPAQIFQTWFQSIKFFSLKKDVLTLAVPNKFFQEMLFNNYIDVIEGCSEKIFEKPLKIHFCIPNSMEEVSEAENVSQQKPINVQKTEKIVDSVTGLNPRYRFDNFVAGRSNEFAFAAAKSVADKPAKSYNPLFMYAGVGLGKTHLMHSIGNYLHHKDPDLKICYLPSNVFLVDMINSLQHQKMASFRKKYRNLDILLIDDIQFIAGKERTEEEFFHTFNTLYEARKQIIISSDTFPKKIPNLEERLRSRFECGLIADIQPPEFETKMAILKKKAEEFGVSISDKVCELMALNINSNIRELEGALLRLGAFSSLTGLPIDEQMAEQTLKDLYYSKTVTILDIQKSVCEHFNVSPSDLKSKSRHKNITFPRQVFTYLARQHTNTSLPEIGKFLGGRDHSSIIYSCKKIEEELKENNEISMTLKQIKSKFL